MSHNNLFTLPSSAVAATAAADAGGISRPDSLEGQA